MGRTLSTNLEKSTLNNGGSPLNCAGVWAKLSDNFSCTVEGLYAIAVVFGSDGYSHAFSFASCESRFW